jgi:hypothetical protein
MKIKNILLWLLSMGATLGAAHAQAFQRTEANQESFAATCSVDFPCDAATLFTLGSQSVVQLTDNSGSFTHYLTFAGIRDASDPTVIHITEIVRDGKHIGSSGTCSLRQAGEIVCNKILINFTVTK